MKKAKALFLFLVLPLLSPSILFAWDAQDLAGNYELEGVHEMAGELTLRPNQTYAAGFAYGAGDWIEEGRWKLDGSEVVFSGSHFKVKNFKDLPLLLPSGTRFQYQTGRLTTSRAGTQIVFINPNKTPSHRKETGKAGEGRMLVRGTVLKLDSQVLMVKTKECIDFAVSQLSPDILKTAKVGKKIDAEIPYSAIIGGESCPK